MNLFVLSSSVGIGAVIGYVTNYVAIKLLFKPYKPVKAGSLTLFPQGVIPREKAALAKKVGEVVKNYILSVEEIKKIINSPAVKEEIQNFLKTKIDEIFERKITEFMTKEEIVEKLSLFIEKFVAEKFPMFAGFLNRNMIISVFENVDFDIPVSEIIDADVSKEALTKEVFAFLEEEVPKIFIKADIDKIVEEKVLSFDEKTLEDMLFSLMEKHFTFINFAGATLGAIIGFIQYFIVSYKI